MGYPVLGRTLLQRGEQGVLTQAVLKGLKEADSSLRGSCFAPRHGLVLPDFRLLICYACHSVLVESKSGERIDLAITNGGREEFVRSVLEHHFEWQGWAEMAGSIYHRSGLKVDIPDGYEAHGLAGTETLYLSSEREQTQSNPIPGLVTLRSDDGSEEALATTWLDHAESKKTLWYLVGGVFRHDRSTNSLVCEVDAVGESQVRAYLAEMDKPARLKATLRLRPYQEERSLETQELKWERDGFEFSELELGTGRFKMAKGVRTGIEVELYVGVLETEAGPVLITAEIPEELKDPIKTLLASLKPSR